MTYEEKGFSEKQQDADFDEFVKGLGGKPKLLPETIKEIERQLKIDNKK